MNTLDIVSFSELWWWLQKGSVVNILHNNHIYIFHVSKPPMNSNWNCHPETLKSEPNHGFLGHVTLKFEAQPWKVMGHLFYATSNFVHHFVPFCEFKLELQSGNQIGAIFFTSVTFTLDFRSWPFACTSLLSMVITRENWWYDDRNIVKRCDKQTERQTDGRRHGRMDRRTEVFLELLCRR